jgi:MFS transporter, CP family, cyanate transporter
MSMVLRRDSLMADGVIRSVCLLWLAGVAMRMTLLVMPPVIPQVHDELHLSETQVGLLIGLPLAVFALAAIPGSLLIARIGATVAVTLGMAIAAVAGGVRAAALDVWTLYAAALASAFGIAIMQPGMPTLVRQWLPNRVATGTIGYSAGMLMGAMLPAVLTIGYVLPAVGCSWRLDVLVWAVPAVLMVPVFYFLLETGRKRLCFRYLSLQRAPESACVKHRCPVKQ